MKAIILDGYVDEPSCLGVPPYISPYARLMYGALNGAGLDTRYATIDQWRSGEADPAGNELLVAIRHVAVPGKYLRGMPASDNELARIGHEFIGRSVVSLGATAKGIPRRVAEAFDHVTRGDPDAYVSDLLVERDESCRSRTYEEWSRWLLDGAVACKHHPDYRGPLIAEMQMYRGCVRYLSGGCGFCIEPLQGEPQFRLPEDIVSEAETLSDMGVRNLRLGAQTCVYSYMAKGIGETETPIPNAESIARLLRAIKENAQPEVFHLDNANPAVIAAHPHEATEVTKAIAEYCTGGNVLALGLESADPAVARANNLNATSDDTLKAVRMINEFGARRGPTGLPVVLPGLNFLCGLKGETKETYSLNIRFMKGLLSERLLLRRINIRQVIPVRDDSSGVRLRAEFSRFRRHVREQVDLPMMERMLPNGTVLSAVYTELREGGRTFGRQAGTYPILVGLPYPYDTGRWVNVSVTGRSPRSVIGIVHPTPVNSSTLSMLEAVPGIGRRRAMAIIRRRPIDTTLELREMLGDGDGADATMDVLTIEDVGEE